MGKWIVEYTVDAGNVQKIEVEADDSLKASRVAEDKLKPRHPGGYVAVRDVIMRNSTAYSNGRMKAETYLNQKMAEAGVKVENIAIYVVEGEEFYGGTVFDAVAAWCKAHRKSEARVTAPGSVAGTYEMTAGGRAIKQ